jgi:hypothetical protein
MAAPILPDLEFRCPDCPLCGVETNSADGAFDCEGCNLTWSLDGTSGERMDPHRPQCLAECMPHEAKHADGSFRYPSLAGRRYACALDADHADTPAPSPHRGVRVDAVDDYYVYTHEWAVESETKVKT